MPEGNLQSKIPKRAEISQILAKNIDTFSNTKLPLSFASDEVGIVRILDSLSLPSSSVRVELSTA